jgi:hypothetical protein
MSAKKFEIQELEERIAPSSLSVGSVLGGVGSVANGSSATSAGSVGDTGIGHIGSGNVMNPALDAAHNNSVDALHDNSFNTGGLNVSNNSPSIDVDPSIAANVNVDANGTSLGGGL